MWGADVERLEALARDLTAAAASLESIGRTVGGRMVSVQWAGRDAGMFRDDWQSRHSAALRAAGETMRSAASTVQAHARDQRKSSEAAGGGAPQDPSTWRQIRDAAGTVGDVAEWVQLGANVVMVGAGAATMAGFVPALPIAGGAAVVSEASGLVSMTGKWIDDPNDPEIAEDAILQSSGVSPKSVDAVDAMLDGTKGLITEVFPK
ncbi:hypothetical protein CLV67_119189 [Actinoplanes italicus]|uniref:WXG100 family type VII secretion target n=2 Tax=Actinoplanes italicus TaxID=113567 RepID=A0A2T0K1D7_9ACTN|nr:hypothetical protein CLV67_119189 [Actinoplanes italicus]